MAGVMAAYGRNDLRNIRRDSLLLGVLAGPFIYSGSSWAVAPLTEFLQREYQFDLTPYVPLIVSAFLVLGPIAVLGAVCGLILLEDKDQRTLAALHVTPAHPASYPVYRLVMMVLVVVVSETAAILISPLTGFDDLSWALPVTVVSGLLATAVGLVMAAWARNKVEGLAVIRALGLVIFMLPLIPWFVDSPWSWAFGVLPSFWPAKATWAAMAGDDFWPAVIIGAVYNGLLVAVLIRRLATRA
ncbi:fluoroquinolone transport system permease protein [Stackebrandtia albiflava]|uniref:Fluoroquinolone transport system permease protein n=1 Tax=Stackebrandtia albiflava TaxID=406432 RepID=A0A562UQE9_9ACTN|nr:ABC transporter permease [Stackebrandtia albiflava]TWJ07841.1 fluoroquinolone transport system permease protein [Stackebrandtia albiflava]